MMVQTLKKWNLEVEPFVAQWVVQTEEDTCELKMVKNHVSFWSVVGKGRCCCWLVLRFQERKDVNQP
jgi:hypothetical protein